MKELKTLARIITVALILTLVFSFAACNLLKGSLKLEAFVVDRSSVKTVYYVGEEINFTGIKATVRYSDETLNTEYTYKDLTITYDSDITATVGTKQVKVSFMDPHLNVEQSTSVQITVKEDPNAVKHASYRIDASAVKTAYVVDETIDFSGIKVYEKFSDSSEVEITDLSLLTYNPVLDGLTATAGNKVVKVQYNGEDAGTITVKVADPEIEKNDVVSTVVGGEYKTTYEVGETIDLTGLTVTLTYEEGEVRVLTHEALTAEAVDMNTAGNKTVVISFTDPINNEEDFTSISITVVKKNPVVLYEKSETFTAFDSDNTIAGSTKYGQTGFSGEFLVGDKLYVIGDDNAFIMIPNITVEEDGVDKDLDKFYSVVDIYVYNGTEYVLAEKHAISDTVYTYSVDSVLVATVDTYNGEYQFASPLEKVKISVKPSKAHYKNVDSFNPVVLEATVIDAYNVYTADQLCVIDNSGRQGWLDFKATAGYADINPAAIVLHDDISIGYANVPLDFFYKSNEIVQYRNTVDNSVKTYGDENGTYYLIDKTMVYQRYGASTFGIQGNFFTISTADFPLVASPSIFGKDAGKDYGSDYSNAALFNFSTINYDWADPSDVSDRASVTIENVAFIGNAGRDSWVVETVHGEPVTTANELVTAGGLIMIKGTRHSDVTLDNVINNSFFLSYFTDIFSVFTVNNSKCYDSYQNAAFVWADATMLINNTYINGTGGPAIITMSVTPGDSGVYYDPRVEISGGYLETHLVGDEVWFKSVGADQLIDDIKALSAGLDMFVKYATQNAMGATWIDSKGQMDIIAALMCESSDAAGAMSDMNVQGVVTVDGTGLNRMRTDGTWATIYGMCQYVPELKAAPFLTVYSGETAYTVYFDGTTFNALPGQTITQELVLAFATADEIVLHQGGLSVMFQLYH